MHSGGSHCDPRPNQLRHVLQPTADANSMAATTSVTIFFMFPVSSKRSPATSMFGRTAATATAIDRAALANRPVLATLPHEERGANATDAFSQRFRQGWADDGGTSVRCASGVLAVPPGLRFGQPPPPSHVVKICRLRGLFGSGRRHAGVGQLNKGDPALADDAYAARIDKARSVCYAKRAEPLAEPVARVCYSKCSEALAEPVAHVWPLNPSRLHSWYRLSRS